MLSGYIATQMPSFGARSRLELVSVRCVLCILKKLRKPGPNNGGEMGKNQQQEKGKRGKKKCWYFFYSILYFSILFYIILEHRRKQYSRHRYRSGYRGRFGDSVIAHTSTREKFSRMGMVATDVFFALEQWG